MSSDDYKIVAFFFFPLRRFVMLATRQHVERGGNKTYQTSFETMIPQRSYRIERTAWVPIEFSRSHVGLDAIGFWH